MLLEYTLDVVEIDLPESLGLPWKARSTVVGSNHHRVQWGGPPSVWSPVESCLLRVQTRWSGEALTGRSGEAESGCQARARAG